MSARKFQITLRVFNPIALVEHEKRNSISRSNQVLFRLSYKHNSPLLTRKADFINEWKLTNQQSPNKKPFSALALTRKTEKSSNHDYKNRNSRNFQLQNSNLLTSSLPKEEVFKVNGQDRPVAKLPVVNFYSQPREMPTSKPLNT